MGHPKNFCRENKKITLHELFQSITSHDRDFRTKDLTSRHSSRMRTDHLSTMCFRCQYWGRSLNVQVWTGLQWRPQGVTCGVGVPCLIVVGGGCTVRSNALLVMVTWNPPCEQTDRNEWKHYLPTTSLAGGSKMKEKCDQSKCLSAE